MWQEVYFYIKRFVDFLAALLGVIILSPVFLLIIIAIELEEPGSNPFFTQKRVGRNKTYFKIYKFRTMKVETPHNIPTHLLKHSEIYITRVGRVLRKTSLDELPQLFNVLQGKLAVVGPRPALWNQYDLIQERDKYDANSLTPGITGWAQIHGRDELTIREKAAFDGFYASNYGIAIDIKILLLTVSHVISSDGVVEGGTGELDKYSKKVS
ncbi:sugar transferase [Alloiococcus sp. CFN-8]|uniref:sugar transferase n=1 Tax=Alloiococcus sp. CFN-8 TaxID=3416081 RepID=UPI003CF02144